MHTFSMILFRETDKSCDKTLKVGFFLLNTPAVIIVTCNHSFKPIKMQSTSVSKFYNSMFTYFWRVQIVIPKMFLQTFAKFWSFRFVCNIGGCNWYALFLAWCWYTSNRMALDKSSSSIQLLLEPTCPSQEGRHFALLENV